MLIGGSPCELVTRDRPLLVPSGWSNSCRVGYLPPTGSIGPFTAHDDMMLTLLWLLHRLCWAGLRGNHHDRVLLVRFGSIVIYIRECFAFRRRQVTVDPEL